MKMMIEQANAYLEMYRTLILSKFDDERGDAVQTILLILGGIALVGIVIGALTVYVQNKTAELGS